MHTFRLLEMAEEIAKEGMLRVRRPNRDYLMKIRAGEFEYDELITMAEAKVESIKSAYSKSDLPEQPDTARLKEILVKIREDRYL